MFPSYIDFLPLELPGRGERSAERLKTDIHELIEDLYEQIKDRLHRPYALMGHSMGSMLIYLLTQKIISVNARPPAHLFISGSRGPSCDRREQRHLLPKDDFLAELIRLGGMPEEILIHQELWDYFEPILRADFMLLETYAYTSPPPIDIPFTIFVGNKDDLVSREVWTWQKESSLPIKLHTFEGGHFFIYENHKTISTIITNRLENIC
jgi:surfactin synthase thioesterase subunit